MRFNLASLEPADQRCGHFLDDGMRVIQCGLEALGHDVSVQLNKLASDRINVVVAPLISDYGDLQTIASAGPYIAIQSEVLTPTGLNSWRNQEQVEKFYLPFLEGAIAVWDAKPTCLAKLREMGLRAYQLPFGYHRRLEEIVPSPHKDIDFSFFGSVTPHRRTRFESLQRRGYRIEVLFTERKLFRDSVISRTKVHLVPWQNADLNQLSVQRVCCLLNNRSLCVVERTPDQDWLEHCFLSADTDEWVEAAIAALERPDREELTNTFFDRYREIRLEDGMQRLLDETWGGSAASLPSLLTFARQSRDRAANPIT